MADEHQVDPAGNLIGWTCVDLRDPAEWFPITVPQRSHPTRHAIRGDLEAGRIPATRRRAHQRRPITARTAGSTARRRRCRPRSRSLSAGVGRSRGRSPQWSPSRQDRGRIVSAKYGRGPCILHGPQEPDGLLRPGRLRWTILSGGWNQRRRTWSFCWCSSSSRTQRAGPARVLVRRVGGGRVGERHSRSRYLARSGRRHAGAAAEARRQWLRAARRRGALGRRGPGRRRFYEGSGAGRDAAGLPRGRQPYPGAAARRCRDASARALRATAAGRRIPRRAAARTTARR